MPEWRLVLQRNCH